MMTDMEYHEVYTADGTPTGEVVAKHAPRRKGDYFLHTIVIMKTEDSPAPGEGEGMYIMQQRSLKARYYAGRWDVTGGGVRADETPWEGAVREAFEELGVRLDVKKLREFHRYRVTWDDGSGLHIFVYACRAKVPENGFIIEPSEVNDVKLAPYREFRLHVMDHNDTAFGQALSRIEREV